METVIVTKMIKQTRDGYMFACKKYGDKKCTIMHGNIPMLYSGIAVDIQYENNKITDYELHFSERTRKILEKNLDEKDFKNFEKRVDLHKELMKENVLWRELTLGYGKIAFQKADRIARHKGKKPDDKDRIRYIHTFVIEMMRRSRKSVFSIDDYIRAFRQLESEGCYNPLSIACLMDALSNDSMFGMDSRGQLYDRQLQEAERYIDAEWKRRKQNTDPFISKKTIESFLEENKTLDEWQREAVKGTLSTRKLDTIIGGAGTGKTTTIMEIVECCKREYGLNALCLLAPTGRASERMTEVIGIVASTIDSKLRRNPESEYVFYNEKNKLPYMLYLVDESSMVNAFLMADFLKAVPENAKIIFVGDCNQLEPIGGGRPFFNFVASKEFYELKNVHRQALQSTIVRNAYHILKDEEWETGEDFTIQNISEDDIVKYASREIQNISPYNIINDTINKNVCLDKMGKPIAGDKVLALKNCGDYCNGEILTILKADEQYSLEKYNKKTVSVDKETMNEEFMFAYAITVHKMQGSECDEINLFLPKERTQFITKNLLYTAVTRAKRKVNVFLFS